MTPNRHLRLQRELLAGPLIGRLKRWTAVRRPTTTAGRWIEWARAIGIRHNLAVERRDSLEMALARRLSLIRYLHTRRLISSRQIAPGLNLAISPVFQKTVFETRYSPLIAPRKVVETANANRSIAPAGEFITTTARRAAGHEKQHAVEQPAPWLSGFDAQATAGRTPLQMVYRRLEEANDVLRRAGAGKVIDKRIEMLTERIIHRSLRSEELKPGGVEMLARRVGSPVAQQASFPLSEGARSSCEAGWTARRGASAAAPPDAMRQPPMINIEQLTDQVMRQLDRRIIAERERMGRI